MLNKICTKCLENKPITDFPFRDKRFNSKRKAYCKLCKQKHYKSRRKKNDVNYRFKKFGFTHEDYLELLESQDHKCAICGKSANTEYHKNFNIDHDHETGKVRGLLCNGCNTGLGLLKDSISNLQSAILYLSPHVSTSR